MLSHPNLKAFKFDKPSFTCMKQLLSRARRLILGMLHQRQLHFQILRDAALKQASDILKKQISPDAHIELGGSG